jgi:hypothetical protein
MKGCEFLLFLGSAAAATRPFAARLFTVPNDDASATLPRERIDDDWRQGWQPC